MNDVDSNQTSSVSADDLEVVCYCAGTRRRQIQDLLDQGIRDFERISRITGACSGCGGCEYVLQQMLGI